MLAIWCVAATTVYAQESGQTEDEFDRFLSKLEFSPEFEIERSRETERTADGETERETGPTTISGNLVFEYAVSEPGLIYFDYEFDSELGYSGFIEELYYGAVYDHYRLVAGRQQLPFGPSKSEFIEGPIAEFAELNHTAILGVWRQSENFSLTGYAFQSDDELNLKDDELEGGIQLGYFSDDRSFSVKLGLLSDLAEVKEPPLAFLDRPADSRTTGYSFSIFYEGEDWWLALEYAAAAEDIEGADPGFDRPSSTYLELFYVPFENWQFGGRLEFSDELEEIPDTAWGLTARYRVDDRLSVGLEYNKGDFDPVPDDEEDDALDQTELISLEVSLEF